MTPQNFERLTQGRDPLSGELLKPRHKQTINLYDLTIGAPKSVSLLALEDERVRAAFLSAAGNIVREAELATPGHSMIYAQVAHYTSRKSEPHLHVHTGIINLTYSAERDRWECLRPNFLYWPRHQMTENHRADLVQNLERLGYGIDDKPRQGFEIEGVSRELMQRFSSRAKEIAQVREEMAPSRFLSTRDASVRTRDDKKEEPATYREYLEFQRNKLTPSERISLNQTVERAYERSHKLRLNIAVAEGEESTPAHRLTYGPRISM
jgi:conjugative relaxase-like TrwC/TraI family protein